MQKRGLRIQRESQVTFTAFFRDCTSGEVPFMTKVDVIQTTICNIVVIGSDIL